MGISRRIIASKEGIIEALEERREQATDAAGNSNTVKRANYERGYAEGIWYAARLIEDWDIEASLEAEREAEIKEMPTYDIN